MTVDRFEGSTPRPSAVAENLASRIRYARAHHHHLVEVPKHEADALLALLDEYRAVAEAARAFTDKREQWTEDEYANLRRALARLAEAEKAQT